VPKGKKCPFLRDMASRLYRTGGNCGQGTAEEIACRAIKGLSGFDMRAVMK
jgi:hypothetical protein